MFNSARKNPFKASEMKALTYKIRDAKIALKERGWEELHSVMHDGGATGNFGTCYVKNGSVFYLNFQTVDQLPV